MANIAFTEWYPEVMPLVSGCPEPLALNAIRNACVDFCTATNWWQGDYGPVNIDATQPYVFVVSSGVHVTQIMHAEIVGKGWPLAITSVQELNNKVVNWKTQTGEPRAVFQKQPGELTTYPIPAGADVYSMQFRLAFTPLRSADEIDGIVHEAYLEEIAAGALSKLLSMIGQPWSNPEAATAYESTFRSAQVAAAIEAAKSYGRQTQQIQLRPMS